MRVVLGILGFVGSIVSAHAQSVTLSPAQAPTASIDFANAKPFPLPQATSEPVPANAAPEWPGVPGASGGSHQAALFIPEQGGTSNHPFTTAHANVSSSAYPADAAGRLFFNIGRSGFVCSASLIKPGVVVTAAHCVANFGHNQFYSGWQFIPGYWNGSAPFGTWTAATAAVLTSYYNGSDSCAQAGVICQDDIALIVLNPRNGRYPGSSYTGWFGYGWNGYSYFPWLGNSQAEITQLGYPVALDGGNIMERTDSLGYASGLSNNTIIGSLMTGGSSGGPWVVNFGNAAVLSGGITNGTASAGEIVVGVTSWGYTNQNLKEMGASPFTSGNIVPLVNYICAHFASAC